MNISRLPVCEECIAAAQPISGSTCGICGERLPEMQTVANRSLCAACQDTAPCYSKAVAYGAYDGELRELIHLLKYERVLPAVALLGRMLAQAIGKLELKDEGALVVPVPLHRSKRRERTFNQAELIAREALKSLGAHRGLLQLGRSNARNAPTPRWQLATEVLLRQRPTISQIGLTRPQRAENIRGAFRVVHPSRVAGKTVLLVDDVLTTGTTVSECARVLRKAGAEKIFVATVARTLKESDAGVKTGVETEEAALVS